MRGKKWTGEKNYALNYERQFLTNKLHSLKKIDTQVKLGLFQTSCHYSAKLVDCSTTVTQLSHEKI